MSTPRTGSTWSYTINVSGDMGVDARRMVRAMEKYKRRNDDGDGSAGVAAMVPAGPDRGDGGMYLDAPA